MEQTASLLQVDDRAGVPAPSPGRVAADRAPPPGTLLGIAAILSLVAAALSPLVSSSPPDASLVIGPIAMTLLALLPEPLAASLSRRGLRDVLVPAEPVLVIGLAFAAPDVLLAARLIAAAVGEAALGRRHPYKLALNLSLCAAETMAAVAVYRAILHGAGPATLLGGAAAAAAVGVSLLLSASAMITVGRLHGVVTPAHAVVRLVAAAAAGTVPGLLTVIALAAALG
jgi:hypothetical protein